MSVSRYLRDALREVLGPSVRARGYRGTNPTWRKHNDLGDVAVINVQSSVFNGPDYGTCVVNLGVAPRPWIEGAIPAFRLAPVSPADLKPNDCLWSLRLHAQTSAAPDYERWWAYQDRPSALRVAEAIVAALESEWFGVLDELLTREGMGRRLLDGDPGFVHLEYRTRQIAAFLPDRPSARTVQVADPPWRGSSDSWNAARYACGRGADRRSMSSRARPTRWQYPPRRGEAGVSGDASR